MNFITKFFENWGNAGSIEDIRGVSDENLKFVHTSNLWLLAMARLMESEGVDDQPLIDELYRRGRNGFEKTEEK